MSSFIALEAENIRGSGQQHYHQLVVMSFGASAGHMLNAAAGSHDHKSSGLFSVTQSLFVGAV